MSRTNKVRKEIQRVKDLAKKHGLKTTEGMVLIGNKRPKDIFNETRKL